MFPASRNLAFSGAYESTNGKSKVQSIENWNSLTSSLLLHILHLHIQSLQFVHACFERVNVSIGLA